VPNWISDEEVRAIKSLCQHPELDTPEALAAGPFGDGDLSASDFAIALLGLRDKSIAYDRDGHWALTEESRKDLCTSSEPDAGQRAKKRQKLLDEMLGRRLLKPVEASRDLVRAKSD
jgi:hypothetical protein